MKPEKSSLNMFCCTDFLNWVSQLAVFTNLSTISAAHLPASFSAHPHPVSYADKFWVTFTFRVTPAPIDRLVILCRSGLLKISLLNIKTLLSGVTMSAKSCPQEIFLFLGYLKGIHHRMVSFLTLSVLSNPIVKLGYYAVIFKLGLTKNHY